MTRDPTSVLDLFCQKCWWVVEVAKIYCCFFPEDVVVDVFVLFFCCRGKLVGGVILIYKVSWVSDEQMSNLNWLCYTKSVWVYECQRATGNGGWALGIVLIVYSMSVERNGKLQLVCDLTSFNCLEICFQEEAWNLRTKVFQDNMHASKVIYRLCISNPKVVIVRFWGILGYTCI